MSVSLFSDVLPQNTVYLSFCNQNQFSVRSFLKFGAISGCN